MFSFKAYKGFFNYQYQKQVKIVMDPWAFPISITPEIETQTEYVPAPFYCSNSCGGNVTDLTNINKFENGECIRQGVCRYLFVLSRISL